MQVLFVGFAKTARSIESEAALERGGQSGKFRDVQPLAPDIGGQPGGLDGPPQRIFGQAAAEAEERPLRRVLRRWAKEALTTWKKKLSSTRF